MSATSATCSTPRSPGGGGALSFTPAGKCPAFEVSQEIASAVRDKEQKDEFQIADLSRRNIPLAPIKTNADGGMHPVFVAAVKRNQIGVQPPQEFAFVSTPPGTIPATVRPPRIPELDDAPIVAGAPAPSQSHASSDVSSSEMAIAPTQPAAKSSGTNLFGRLFSSGSAEKKSDGPIDRVARLIGLGGKDQDTKKAEAAPRRLRSRNLRPNRPAWPPVAPSAPSRPKPRRSRPPKQKPRRRPRRPVRRPARQ